MLTNVLRVWDAHVPPFSMLSRSIGQLFSGQPDPPPTPPPPPPRVPLGAGATEKDPNVRAKALFMSCLTPEQRIKWERDKYLVIRGQLTGTRYVLKEDMHPCALNAEGRRCIYYCIYPRSSIQFPLYDVRLAQKLWLETNEQMFFAKAYGSMVSGDATIYHET